MDENLYEALANATVVDQEGNKVGKVDQLYLDNGTGQPSWVSVHTGLLGMNESFVPLQEYDLNLSEIIVPFTKDFITGAPSAESGKQLDVETEDKLYHYYGIDSSSAAARTHEDPALGHVPAAERDTENAGFNKTAGLNDTRPAAAERETDHIGGLDSPTNQAAMEIPPATGAEPDPRTRNQADGVTGYPDQGASGAGTSRLRRYERG